MASWLIQQEIDLQRGAPVPQVWPNALQHGDNQAHTWRVAVLDGGAAAVLSGSVTGHFVRADGATVTIEGTLSGNVATVLFDATCYAYEGALTGVMRITTGGQKITLAATIFHVRKDLTDVIVDPGTAIPSLEELLAQIDECRTATDAANQAAADVAAALNANADPLPVIRYDAAQGLSDAQKAQARDNIGAASSASLIDFIYPVGTPYERTVNISPASFLGGTWATLAPGRVLIGVDSDDADYNAARMTGGNKNITGTANGNYVYDPSGTNGWLQSSGAVGVAYLPPAYKTNLQPYYTVYRWERIA